MLRSRPARAQFTALLRSVDDTDRALHSQHTTTKKRNRRTSIPSAGFNPAIPAIKRLHTYALDRTANDIGSKYQYVNKINKKHGEV